MQLIKSIALVAVLAVCFVHATILSDSVSLLEAHVKDAETLASRKQPLFEWSVRIISGRSSYDMQSWLSLRQMAIHMCAQPRILL